MHLKDLTEFFHQPSESTQDICDMTNRYTHDEWLTIIDRAKDNFQSISVDYKAPNIGTEAFAKSIDHTLLKLDATKEQIDKLCEEARRHNFKVLFPIRYFQC